MSIAIDPLASQVCPQLRGSHRIRSRRAPDAGADPLHPGDRRARSRIAPARARDPAPRAAWTGARAARPPPAPRPSRPGAPVRPRRRPPRWWGPVRGS
jgi:hypothetical protein